MEYSSPLVSASGPIDAKIILVGEAPARNEIEKMKPFVGIAGQYLTAITQLAELDRDTFYIDNLSRERAPNDKMDQMPKDRLKFWTQNLIERLNELPNPKILVPLGNYALRAITGKWGIQNFRGSILRPIKDIHHNCIVLPTIHPSTMNYQFEIWPLIESDFEKLKRIIDNSYKFKFPQFNFIIKPTLSQILERFDWFEQHLDHIYTLDVETPHGYLSCFGIGWSKTEAICIPLMYGDGSNYWTEIEEKILWRRFSEILPKMNINNQNFLFDWEILARHGIWLKMPKYDPMLMHHCLYSSLPHSLHIITSLYTDIPFYKKDEREEKGKSVKGSALRSGFEEEHWQYNALDCCAAWWAIEELKKELIKEDMMKVYEKLYIPLFAPLLKMNMSGIRVDMQNLVEHRKFLSTKNKSIEENLEKVAGHSMNPKSPKQVKKFLIDERGMKPYHKRSGAVTMDEESLEKLAHKYKTKIPLQIIESRKISRELSLFSDENIVEGRLHCRYKASGTSTGRLASVKSVVGKGMNLQNVKDSVARKMFIAEDGHILLGADLKAADACSVAWYSRDLRLIAAVESGRLHFENAKNLFGHEVEKGDEEYKITKRVSHGSSYDMGYGELARQLDCSTRKAKDYMESYHRIYPGIRQIFHKYVQDEIKSKRMLYNPFGRRMVFFGRKDRDTFKKGYAFLGQSTTGDLNKTALARIFPYFQVLLELHDGLILTVPKDKIEEAIRGLRWAYDIYFKIWGVPHKIAIEISIGENWYNMKNMEKD